MFPETRTKAQIESDLSQEWLYPLASERGGDPNSTGNFERVDDYWLSSEGSALLEEGEDSDRAAQDLADALDCPVAIVAVVRSGGDDIEKFVCLVVSPRLDTLNTRKGAGR